MTGFGEGFIPRKAIRDYAVDEGLDVDELVAKVRALDVHYLNHRKEQREREQERKKREQDRSERLRRGGR